ncbi:MAG: hypothetical protein H0X12_17135, partial [Nocardioides sp.]|nr:hypothetical protein [Nocardioides sp.]
DELWADLGEPRAHYISLFKSPPSAAATSAVHNLDLDGEVVRVVDRAAHVLLQREFHENRALSSREFKALGEGTARNVTVIRALATKWG